ncbi:unnamed protein product [Calypogeia fissa]
MLVQSCLALALAGRIICTKLFGCLLTVVYGFDTPIIISQFLEDAVTVYVLLFRIIRVSSPWPKFFSVSLESVRWVVGLSATEGPERTVLCRFCVSGPSWGTVRQGPFSRLVIARFLRMM